MQDILCPLHSPGSRKIEILCCITHAMRNELCIQLEQGEAAFEQGADKHHLTFPHRVDHAYARCSTCARRTHPHFPFEFSHHNHPCSSNTAWNSSPTSTDNTVESYSTMAVRVVPSPSPIR